MGKRGRVLLATNNEHKLREYRALLGGLDAELVSPAQLGIGLRVAEDEPTFAGNATVKALAFARASGLVAMADDSGLEVAAIGGKPGVRSARYGGPGASDRDRIELLLAQLRGVPAAERTARFVCVIAVATPEGELRTVEGECRGVIAEAPRGEHGFGYDPVFHLPALGKTLAELPTAQKNRLSHRGRAARAARPILQSLVSRASGG